MAVIYHKKIQQTCFGFSVAGHDLLFDVWSNDDVEKASKKRFWQRDLVLK